MSKAFARTIAELEYLYRRAQQIQEVRDELTPFELRQYALLVHGSAHETKARVGFSMGHAVWKFLFQLCEYSRSVALMGKWQPYFYRSTHEFEPTEEE